MRLRLRVPLLLAACGAFALAEPTPEQIRLFESKIRPILAGNCYQCHSAADGKFKGGLTLDTRDGWAVGGDSGPAIVPGKPGESLLIQAIRHANKKLAMPKQAPKLSEAEINTLTRWVAAGAPDPRVTVAGPVQSEIDYEQGRAFWAFQPVASPAPPAPADKAWARGDIDRFVRAAQEAKGLDPAPDAAPGVWLRRVTFDLCGLPPSPEDLDSFLADPSPAARARVVDEMLGSSHYGERWARHWMDVARYAESTGMERNYTFPAAWRYRDYLIDSFNRDVPYNRFILEQLAGDLMEPEAESDAEINRLRVATGFLAMGPKSLNSRDKAQFKADIVDEQIDVTSRAVLGLTVSCARCHDHKFDPISQADYYAMAGYFHSTDTHYGTGGGNGNRNAAKLMPLVGEDPGLEKRIAAHKTKVAAKQKEMQTLQRQVARLRAAVKKAEGDRRKEMNREMQAANKRIQSMKREVAELNKKRPPPGDQCMGVLDATSCANSRIMLRGDVRRLGPEVPRGTLTVIDEKPPAVGADESGRRQLAEWMSSERNPLTARVQVNRIWHHLFGQGIVRSVDNFGQTGERPSHPDLLDHLARRYMDLGWSTKKLIREIVLSRTYGLSSDHVAANYEIDPENRLLWQASHRRLDAESIRDAVLAASGQLDISPQERSVVAEIGDANVGRNPKLDARITGPTNHRSVYLPILRNMVPESLRVFDFAEPSMLVGTREITTVPTQALYLFNSKFIADQAGHMATRLEGDEAARVRQAFRLALAREPSEQDRKRTRRFIADCREAGTDPWTQLCQSLMASAEFRYLD